MERAAFLSMLRNGLRGNTTLPGEGPATHLFLVLICSRSYKKKSDFAGPP